MWRRRAQTAEPRRRPAPQVQQAQRRRGALCSTQWCRERPAGCRARLVRRIEFPADRSSPGERRWRRVVAAVDAHVDAIANARQDGTDQQGLQRIHKFVLPDDTSDGMRRGLLRWEIFAAKGANAKRAMTFAQAAVRVRPLRGGMIRKLANRCQSKNRPRCERQPRRCAAAGRRSMLACLRPGYLPAGVAWLRAVAPRIVSSRCGQLALEAAVGRAVVFALDAQIVLRGDAVGAVVGILVALRRAPAAWRRRSGCRADAPARAAARPSRTSCVGASPDADRRGVRSSARRPGRSPPGPGSTGTRAGRPIRRPASRPRPAAAPADRRCRRPRWPGSRAAGRGTARPRPLRASAPANRGPRRDRCRECS